MSKLLLVVDMQNDFITGSLKNALALGIVSAIRERIRVYRENGDDVAYTMDEHEEDYLDTPEGKELPIKHCIKGTWGAQIVKELTPREGCDAIYRKSSYGYKEWPALRDKLEKYSSITLVGTCTNICVLVNAVLLRTHYPSMPIYCILKECAATSPDKQLASKEVLESIGVRLV